MDDRELERLLSDLESDRVERTESFTKEDKFGEAICAFANDLANTGRPGYLFVGIDDAGMPTRRPVTDELLRTLAGLREDGRILPRPHMSVEKRRLAGADVAVVEVWPDDLPPVRYNAVVWVRIGPRRARATEADERRLMERRAHLAKTFDARPCMEAGLDDLVLQLFEGYRQSAVAKEVLAENQRSIEDQLASLRFFDRRSGRPTHAGVLLFGKDPRFFLPGAAVQHVAYEGVDAGSDIAGERILSGDLFTVLRGLGTLADDLAQPRLVEESSTRERTVYAYPPAAMREVFMNAVIHRDYESNSPTLIQRFRDRIEVLSPGGLYGDLRPEDFPAVAYRNPVLAEAAKTLGFVNRFGRGVPRTYEAMRENGSPEPKFEPKPRQFLVTLPRHA